jgi:gliding motility-associated-like protein
MGIGLKCRKILLTLALIKVASSAFAQIYVSPKVCVSDITMDPQGTPQGCEEPTYFFDKKLSSVSWVWSFGDGGTNTVERNPKYLYKAPGDYTLSLTRTDISGAISTETQPIKVGTYPQQPQFNKKNSADTTVCDKNGIKLDPYKGLGGGGNNVSYLWFPNGETTPTIDVDTSGCYSVEVIDNATKCSRTAKITVKFCLQDSPAGGGTEKWYFGDGAVLDFAFDQDTLAIDTLSHSGPILDDPQTENPTYSPRPSTQTHPMSAEEGVAMVYGPDGSLKFYSDGKKVYAGEDDSVIPAIAGSNDINPGQSTSQGVVIVPKSSCNECPHHQYYLFTVDQTTKILSYSILDMRYNGKKGALTEINVPVMYPVTDRITAFQNTSQTGFVIVAHEADSDLFRMINVDSTGLNFVDTKIGTPQNTTASKRGYLVIEDGKTKAAQGLVEGGKNYVEIYDVDPTNMTLSNPMKIDLGIPAPPEVYGVGFAPNGDILYVTVSGSGSDPSYLIQLPLLLGSKAAIEAGKQIIDTAPPGGNIYGAVQMGPVNGGEGERYVYIALRNQKKVLYLQNPDVVGNAAVVGFSNSNGVALAGTSKLGFPTVTAATPVQDGQGVSATYSGNCFKAPTVLHTDGACDPLRNKITWEFEDGTTKEGKDVSYTFPKTGWNKIKIIIEIFNPSPLQNVIKSQIINKALETQCSVKTIIDSVYILPAPNYTLADEAYVCVLEGATYNATPVVKLEKGETIDHYLWMTSVGTTLGTQPVLPIKAPGLFKVELTNNFDCMVPDSILIKEGCEPRIFVPDAFTPNNDLYNDNLDVYYKWITDYELKVFNRWGELIFSSDKPDIKWDGKVKGKIFAPMVYPYIIYYKSTYFPQRGVLTKKGAVTVLN